MDEINEKYWISWIKANFEQNLNLFSEYEIVNKSNITSIYNSPIFKDGYKLKPIDVSILLQYIKKVILNSFNNCQYFVSTRSKYDTSNYFIVISLLQNNPIQAIAIANADVNVDANNNQPCSNKKQI